MCSSLLLCSSLDRINLNWFSETSLIQESLNNANHWVLICYHYHWIISVPHDSTILTHCSSTLLCESSCCRNCQRYSTLAQHMVLHFSVWDIALFVALLTHFGKIIIGKFVHFKKFWHWVIIIVKGMNF